MRSGSALVFYADLGSLTSYDMLLLIKKLKINKINICEKGK